MLYRLSYEACVTIGVEMRYLIESAERSVTLPCSARDWVALSLRVQTMNKSMTRLFGLRRDSAQLGTYQRVLQAPAAIAVVLTHCESLGEGK